MTAELTGADSAAVGTLRALSNVEEENDPAAFFRGRLREKEDPLEALPPVPGPSMVASSTPRVERGGKENVTPSRVSKNAEQNTMTSWYSIRSRGHTKLRMRGSKRSFRTTQFACPTLWSRRGQLRARPWLPFVWRASGLSVLLMSRSMLIALNTRSMLSKIEGSRSIF